MIVEHEVVNTCRVCGGQIFQILSYGLSPLADRLMPSEAKPDDALFAPLTLMGCSNCELVQIRETVPPTVLFESDYPYFSSISPALSDYFAKSAGTLLGQDIGNNGSFVVEAASNDGYLLKHFKAAGAKVLGVDPAIEPVTHARNQGIETWNTYFNTKTAKQIVDRYGHANLFLANNVLAHTPYVVDFVKAIKLLLREDGLAVIETPYLIDLLAGCEFDTVYHQHVFYYSVKSLDYLFNSCGLYIHDVKRTWVHGGSLRLRVSPKKPANNARVDELRELESSKNLVQAMAFKSFLSHVQMGTDQLTQHILDLKQKGRRVAAYGAAAKGTVRLAFCGLDYQHIDYVVDLNTFKQGKLMPGSAIPIVGPEVLKASPPDVLLILAWNFSDEIMSQQTAYSEAGGRFIIPAPEFQEL